MKRLFLIGTVVLSLFSTMAFAYQITVDNTYDGDVLLTIDQAGTGKVKIHTLPANRVTTVETGKIAWGPAHYCIKKMFFRALNGPAKGNQTSVRPPHTGYDIRCSNLTGGDFVKIIGAQDNTLVVQMPTPRDGYRYKLENTTDRQVVAHFRRYGGYCALNPQFLIEPHQTREIRMGTCTISSIFFRFASGPDPRTTSTWKSNNPGGSHTLAIKVADDGSLVVEQK